METRALLAPDATSSPRQCRARVLDLLRLPGSPLGGHEVADRGRLHPDTVRFHLDGLVEAALATRERQAQATPGRPGMAYRASDDGGPTGERRYRLLAEMLTALITGMMPDPGKAALEAGREWGFYLTEQSPPTNGPAPGRPIERLAAIMGKLGFAPQADAHGRRYRLLASVPVPGGGTAAPGRRLLAASGADAGRPGSDAGPAHRRPARCAHRSPPVHCSSDSRRWARPQAAARRYGLTAGRMRNWQCQTVPRDPARGRTARRYSKEDPCANTAAAKPWPLSVN
jgi:predicted ArsR family transcriptional regulator